MPPDDWKWPEFDEPELIERLGMDDKSFFELWIDLTGQMPVREYSEELFQLGTGYPWPRPAGSFVLNDGKGHPVSDLDPETKGYVLEEFSGPRSGRTPMLAIGSNASPEGLWRKFAHFEQPADRTLLAVTGQLHGFDIGASAELALYGAMPATIFPSPGTRVATTAVWLTDIQLTQLAWAEIPYRIGRLEARFDSEQPLAELGFTGLDSSLVFVNRFGTFAPDGLPYALAAIPASGRTAKAMVQVDLLERLASLAYGPGCSARQLVRGAFENLGEVGPRVASILRSHAIPFESDRWTPLPG